MSEANCTFPHGDCQLVDEFGNLNMRIAILEAENAALKDSIENGYKPCQEQLEGWLEKANAENAALREQIDELRSSIVAAIDGKPCPTPAQWKQMQAAIDAARKT